MPVPPPTPQPPSPTPLSALGSGTVIAGRYRLDRVVTADGRSTTWRAVDDVLARPVSLRVVSADTDRDLLFAAVSRAGVVSDARLSRVLDASTEDTADGTIGYVVTEWVGAPSLAALLGDGPLPPAEAAYVVAEAAAALAAAAARGATHGDLGPTSVRVLPAGGVKVTGLEVATALTDPGDDRARDDTYRLGALLYAAVTGCWPDGPAYGLPAAPRQNGRACTPRQVRAGVPRDVDIVAMRLLRTGAPGTPTTPAEAADLLSSLPREPVQQLPDAPTPAPTPPVIAGGGRGPLMWAALAALLVLLAVAGWLVGTAVTHQSASRPVPSFSSAPGSTTRPVAALHPLQVTDFNPGGNGPEDAADVPLVTDGNPSTAWETHHYDARPDFGGLKSGVGLLFDFGKSVSPTKVQVVLTTPGADLELRAGGAAPAQATDLTLAASRSAAPATVELAVKPGTHGRYWLVWLTRLPAQGAQFREGVAEIKFAG